MNCQPAMRLRRPLQQLQPMSNPSLGIVERAKGQVAGFGYSASLKAVAAKGEKWGFEALDGFLAAPKGYLPGTTMSFAGISNPKTRADLIAYLNGISDSPVAIPQ